MSVTKKHFTLEEKLELVKLSLSGPEKPMELASRYGIAGSTLYSWRKKFTKGEVNIMSEKNKKEKSESERRIEELEKELRETKLERDILKKAVGIFSKPDRKSSNS